ncbi:hypothetical protein [Rivihabitans pingtungensis]|uniref:hypothetical protein n=1 Tax=Rivihabitans pingtungensis TaxID=1054498 RepID=UPI0023531549|nr:hypothetical protein [Rivihabitans pingtungensis]MCK6435983.1 hypothetical protein [Rivihabitans pingtungensis]
MGETEYLTRKEFAESQGWSPSYVTKLAQQQRLVLSPCGKKVNVAATLARIGKTADPSKEGVRHRHEQARIQRDVYGAIHSDAPSTADPGDYQGAKARREHYLALLAAAEYNKVCGETVERKRVIDAAFLYGRLMRDTMLGLPKQIAADLAAISDPWELERTLTDSLRKALDDIAKLGEDDLNKAMTQ